MSPKNAISMIKSELTLIITAMKWDSRMGSRTYNDETYKSLFKGLVQLRAILNEGSDLDQIEPLVYLTPFLNVIKSESLTGYITDLALTSVDKFLSYGLIEQSNHNFAQNHGPGSVIAIASAVDAIANAVTKTRFASNNRQADEVVLMRIIHLLRNLLLLPAGTLVTNDSIAKILQVCFQLCFEAKLSDLLRKTSESVLASIIQLFFFRLSSLKYWHPESLPNQDSSKNDTHNVDSNQARFIGEERVNNPQVEVKEVIESLVADDLALRKSTSSLDDDAVIVEPSDYLLNPESDQEVSGLCSDAAQHSYISKEEARKCDNEDHSVVQPYDLLAIYRLFDYLITCLDNENSADNVILTALNLITVALETGADSISKSPVLMQLVQTRLTKNLILVNFFVSIYLLKLLNTDRAGTLTSTCRTSFLLFEAMRAQLKLQMEVYIERLVELISVDNLKTPPDLKVIGLDALVQLFSLPCFPVEVYVNYDCDSYASSIFELVAETLCKNSYTFHFNFSTGKHSHGVAQLNTDSFQMVSLDALLNIMEVIETNCTIQEQNSITGLNLEVQDSKPALLNINESETKNKNQSIRRRQINRHFSNSGHIPSSLELSKLKHRKRVLIRGTNKFNLDPKTGIIYLQKHRLLEDPLNADEFAEFLINNPRLDKKIIGDYLSNRKNLSVLAQFVKKLNFSGMRIDQALRIYLEAFRLPGEAPLIQNLMEHFAEQWSIDNHQPFANVDAAFTLSYAILMLNTDQHNPNSKKQNIPMNLQAFQRNLKGMNGGENFDQELLSEIFNEIKENEIVMPSEQIGLVRDNYLWKCLLNRCQNQSNTKYIHIESGSFNAEMFSAICGPLLAALVQVFERSGAQDALAQLKTVSGFAQCARMASYFGMSQVLDMILMEMCKFTGLLHNPGSSQSKSLNSSDTSIDQLAVSFGRNSKSRLAANLAFSLVAHHADQLRDGWRALIECILQFFRTNLLPRALVESEDFTQSSRFVRLTPKGPIKIKPGGNQDAQNKSELGVLSSFYQFFYSGNTFADQKLENPIAKPEENMDSERDSTQILTLKQMCIQINSKTLLSSAVMDSIAMAQAISSYNESFAKQAAMKAVEDLNINQLIVDTKFLLDDSLQELITALLSYIYDDKISFGASFTRDLVDQHLVKLWEDLSQANTNNIHSKSTHDLIQNIKFYHSLMLDATQSCSGIHQDHLNVSLSASAPNLAEQSLNLVDDLKSARIEDGETTVNKRSSISETKTPALPVSSECRIFCLELLMKVLLNNRDRVSYFWPKIRIHLAEIILCSENPTFLVERVCVGLIRLAGKMLRKQEMTLQILLFLHTLLVLKAPQLLVPQDSMLHPFQQKQYLQHRIQLAKNSSSSYNVSEKQAFANAVRFHKSLNSVYDTCVAQQVIKLFFFLPYPRGLGDLMNTHAADLATPLEWHLVFSLLSIAGASLRIVPTKQLVQFSWKTYDELPELPITYNGSTDFETQSWVHISLKQNNSQETPKQTIHQSNHVFAKFSPNELSLPIEISLRDVIALEKACESLAFIIKDPAYLMPDNYESCVYCLRVFIEACICTKSNENSDPKILVNLLASRLQKPISNLSNLDRCQSPPVIETTPSSQGSPNLSSPKHQATTQSVTNLLNSYFIPEGDFEKLVTNIILEEKKNLVPVTENLAVQILDLVFTLFMRTTSIYTEWAKEQLQYNICSPKIDVDSMWETCWLPLLKATARLATDSRKHVRSEAMGYLQRELHSSILQPLQGKHWVYCFEHILFPLLSAYLENIAVDEALKELRESELTDPKMRAIPFITKIFLQHLTPLCELPEFLQIWDNLLSFMEHFVTASSCDSLNDAVRESLKNVLLVMYTSSILKKNSCEIWNITQNRLQNFLPNLLIQLFPDLEEPSSIPPHPMAPTESSPIQEYSAIPSEQHLTAPIITIPEATVSETNIYEPAELMERGEVQYNQVSINNSDEGYQPYQQIQNAQTFVYPLPNQNYLYQQYHQPFLMPVLTSQPGIPKQVANPETNAPIYPQNIEYNLPQNYLVNNLTTQYFDPNSLHTQQTVLSASQSMAVAPGELSQTPDNSFNP